MTWRYKATSGLKADQICRAVRISDSPTGQVNIRLHLHRDDGLVPLRVEGLHVVAPELNFQEVG